MLTAEQISLIIDSEADRINPVHHPECECYECVCEYESMAQFEENN